MKTSRENRFYAYAAWIVQCLVFFDLKFQAHREQLSSQAPSAIIGFTEIPERLPVKLLLSDVHN